MKGLIHLFLVMVTSTLLANPNSKLDFIDGSLNLAIQKAGQEGKLLFVEFGAKWCMQCRFMAENTFQDPEVIQYMTENYVPVKIDVDDFDGLAYKQKYQVEDLPTFLIFNSEGKVIGRYEQSMAPANLLNILKEHNQDINRQPIPTDLSAYEIEAQLHEQKKSRINVSPYDATPVIEETETSSTEIAQPKEEVVNEETMTEESPLENISAQDSETDTSDELEYEAILIEEAKEPSIKEQIAIETSGELLWEDDEEYEIEMTDESHQEEATYLNETLLESTAPTIKFYTVRIGTFDNNVSMESYVKATSALFVEDTHIFENQIDGNSTYEVCLGAFATESSAKTFLNRLNTLNVMGEIKQVEQ